MESYKKLLSFTCFSIFSLHFLTTVLQKKQKKNGVVSYPNELFNSEANE